MKVPVGVINTSIYHLILESAGFGEESSLLSVLDTAYLKVVQAGSPTKSLELHKAHAFVLEDRNPLHMLLQLSATLVGNHLLGGELTGFRGYILHLLAVSSALAFGGLQKCLDRNSLASSSYTRVLTLVVYISLLLEQVLEIKDYGTIPLYFSGDGTYETMHRHLTEYLFYYLWKLGEKVFDQSTPFLTSIKKARKAVRLPITFWEKLSEATGLSILKESSKATRLSTNANTQPSPPIHKKAITNSTLDVNDEEGKPDRSIPLLFGKQDLIMMESPGWKQTVDAWLMSISPNVDY